MANAAHNAPKLELGKLSPEEAERLASTFRPIWELDDAPFAQGSGLSAADVDALSAGAGVAPSVRGTDQQAQGGTYEIKSAPPPRVPGPDEPKVEIAVEPVPKPPPPRRAAPQAPPAPAPARVVADAGASGEFVPVKKSNTAIILVAVSAVALIGILIGVHSLMSSKPTGSSTAITTTATSDPTHAATTAIPPPPPETAAAAQPEPQPTEQHAATPPPEPTQQPVETAPTHVAAAPTHAPVHHAPVTAPRHTTHVATHTAHHAGGGGHLTIVRDNPF